MAYDVHEILVTGMKNAYALESQALDAMKTRYERMTEFPAIRERIGQHITETERQQQRLEQALTRYDETPSTLKDMALRVAGGVKAAMHASSDDEPIKAALDSVAFEHYEVASYKSLIALAQAAGEQDLVRTLEQSLREEEDMARFVDGCVEQVTLQFAGKAERDEEGGVGVM